jgi:hypothetical protein
MHVILTITQKFLSCRHRLADRFLTVVIEKRKTLKVPTAADKVTSLLVTERHF